MSLEELLEWARNLPEHEHDWVSFKAKYTGGIVRFVNDLEYGRKCWCGEREVDMVLPG